MLHISNVCCCQINCMLNKKKQNKKTNTSFEILDRKLWPNCFLFGPFLIHGNLAENYVGYNSLSLSLFTFTRSVRSFQFNRIAYTQMTSITMIVCCVVCDHIHSHTNTHGSEHKTIKPYVYPCPYVKCRHSSCFFHFFFASCLFLSSRCFVFVI